MNSIIQLTLRPHRFFARLYALEWYANTLIDWVNWLQPLPSHDLLEVGCNSGGLSRELAKQGHTVVALDSSIRATQYAGQQPRLPSLHFIAGDALRLPFQSDQFHCVLAASLLNVVKYPERLLAELVRVTAVGGKVSCLFPTPVMQYDSALDFIRTYSLKGFSADALLLWAKLAKQLNITTVTEMFHHAGLRQISSQSFLQGMVGAVSGYKGGMATPSL